MRRDDDCSKHSAEIAKIRDLEMRVGANPMEGSGSGAQRSGGMGRGY